MSHCDWNLVLESLSMGVPMGAEQPFNSKVVERSVLKKIINFQLLGVATVSITEKIQVGFFIDTTATAY